MRSIVLFSVDVGGKHDFEGTPCVLDHHQKGFEGTLPGYETKLSSAGLVYKHFGREVLHEWIHVFLYAALLFTCFFTLLPTRLENTP